MEEVENALSAFNSDWEKHEYLSQALDSNRKAYTSTEQLYQKGFKGYKDVLEVQQSLLESEASLTQIQVDLLIRYISLYKALGGGWSDEWCD